MGMVEGKILINRPKSYKHDKSCLVYIAICFDDDPSTADDRFIHITQPPIPPICQTNFLTEPKLWQKSDNFLVDAKIRPT